MPDTLDGRFAVLATIAALALVRLEQLGDAGNALVGGADRAVHRSDGSGASRARARRSDARQDRAQAGRLAGAADRAVARRDRGSTRDWRDVRRAKACYKSKRRDAALRHVGAGAARAYGRGSSKPSSPRSPRGGSNDRPLRPPAPARPDPRRRADRPRRRRGRARARSPRGSGSRRSTGSTPTRPCRATATSFAPQGRLAASLDPKLRHHRRAGRRAYRRAVRPSCSCPSPPADAPDEEIELGEADCDVVFYDGATIDLGGAIADTLALSLDPYPRSAGADAALKEAGV